MYFLRSNGWDAYILSPDRAAAGTKRLSNLLRSKQWSASAIDEFLEQQADAELAAADPGLEQVLADERHVLYRVRRDGPPPTYPTSVE